ncbi:MAG: ATP-dependent zinc metalloprotease FtsH [Flavobacteriales bacterium]|nr:ATP-dependent zinc metalloprotease FtsH [Flavobacteriales bacterium]MDG1396660.1 ATP-dependent zinc metalloprotease FtsH [Flavobacteriales bacterium]
MVKKKKNTTSKKQGKQTEKKLSKLPKFNFYWIYGIVVFFMVSMLFSNEMGALSVETNRQTLIQEYIKNKDVAKIEIIQNKNIAKIFIKESALSEHRHEAVSKPLFGEGLNKGPHYYIKIGTSEVFETKIEEAQESFRLTESERVQIFYNNEQSIWDSIWAWMPFIFLIGIWLFFMRRMSGGGGSGPGSQIFNIGKSQAQLYDKDTEVKTTFKDVAGLEGAKEEVQEIVDFLKNPKKYTKLGGKIPRGALLVGPPGTGKTLLAKAVAGEAQVPFFSLSGSDFVEMFVGVGASRVRDLFKKAKDKSPAIIFIDEIDAIGRARGKNQMTGSNDERENTLNQLLTEMDGFGTNDHVIVIAATNRADILDRALVRAGRFDRQIFVDLPELNERKEIFEVHLAPLKIEAKLDLNFLAKQTPGFSGADISNMCNEAALIAARKDKKFVEKQDFLDAVDRIIGGLEKKNKIISKKEREVIAFHEAGHATVSWMLEHAAPLVKVTIVPRGKSLGAAWYLPEERQITTREQMMDEMCAALGGRAAEKIIFGKVSTGALSDLEKVTRQATAMVTVYGLSDKIGNISYYDSSGQNSSFNKPYSEQTARTIDEEVRAITEEAYARALQVLEENKESLSKLAHELLKKEVIFREDLEILFGKRLWDSNEKITLNPSKASSNEDTKDPAPEELKKNEKESV